MLNDYKLAKEPKVSVIIEYLNSENYIQDCIYSILNQEYGNFEIIIVNKKPDKESVKILDEIETINTKVINSTSYSFKEALKMAKGEYLLIIDANVILLSNCLAIAVDTMLNNKISFVSLSGIQMEKANDNISSSEKSKFYKKADRIFYEQIKNLYNNSKKYTVKINSPQPLPYKHWNWDIPICALISKDLINIIDFYPDIRYWTDNIKELIFPYLRLNCKNAQVSATCYIYRDKKEYSNEEIITKTQKLQTDLLSMFKNNKKALIKKYSLLKYFIILNRIKHRINIKTCAKIIKTFAHELIGI